MTESTIELPPLAIPIDELRHVLLDLGQRGPHGIELAGLPAGDVRLLQCQRQACPTSTSSGCGAGATSVCRTMRAARCASSATSRRVT